MPKVLICSHSYPPESGGIARYASRLANELQMAGMNVTVITKKNVGGDGADQACAHKVIRYVSSVDLYLKWIAEAIKSDVMLIVQRGKFLSLAYYFNKILNRPYVLAVHGRETINDKINSIVKKVNCASAIVPGSQYTAEHYMTLGVDKNLITIINYGADIIPLGAIDLRKKYNLQNKLIILTVARLIKHKGQDNLLKAFPKILEKVENAHYLIVGNGPDRKYLEEIAQDLKLENHITFTSSATEEELAACYHQCDIFAMISRREGDNVEGFGIAFLEAGSAGKAVVGGDSGGIPDAVKDDVTGVLVDPCSVEKIADTLTTLLLDKHKREYYGSNGKQRVENDSTWDKVAQRYLSLFTKILGGK